MLTRTVIAAVAVLAAFTGILLLAPVGIEPILWNPAPAPSLTGIWQPNNRLDSAVLEQSGLPGPDTVLPGADGLRYAAIGDGRIVRWRKDGPIEEFARVNGRPVGMNFGADGSLYAADEERGVIWKITPDRRVSRLTERIGERKFNLLNDVWIARDGRVFFTESTARWPLAENQRALLEHGGDGGVYVWHPDGRVTQVLDDLNFANGVVLSQKEDYLLVAETGSYRITRLWLTGPRAGQREALLDNLPGFPGDLSVAPDGESYWCSFFTPRKRLLDKLGPHPWARKLVGLLPLSWLPESEPYPFVFRFNGQGQVLETLQATPDSKLPSFSSVVQDGDELLLGTPGGVGAIDSDRVYRVRLQ